MKDLFIILSISSMLWLPVHAQDSGDDPLAESYVIQVGGGEELVALSHNQLSIYKYFEEMASYFCRDTLINTLNYASDIYFTDACAENFDQDQFAEIAVAGEMSGRAKWALLKPDPGLLSINSLASWKKTIEISVTGPAIYHSDEWQVMSPLFIKSGNFDHDEHKEIALAYWADSGQGEGRVRILIYDVNDSLSVTCLGEIMEQKITNPPVMGLCEDDLYLFKIACADLNGDGIDEILLAGRTAFGASGWEMFVRIYAWDASAGVLTEKARASLFSRTDCHFDISNFNIATGHFFSPDREHGVLGLSTYVPGLHGTSVTADTIACILIPFATDSSLENISVGEPAFQAQDTLTRACWAGRMSSLIGVDINHDGVDEIISAFTMPKHAGAGKEYRTAKIFQGTPPLGLTVWAELDTLIEKYGHIAVGDIKTEAEGVTPVLELVVNVDSYPDYHANLYQIESDASGNFTGLRWLDRMARMNTGGKTQPLLASDFDQDIRLGKPVRYSMTKILQPLVILNAPPIHFDVFDEEIFDVSLSYNDNVGQFISHYAKESSQATEVSSEFTQDWGTSTTLKAGGSYCGVSVSAHLTEKYGKRFSKHGGHSTKVTVSIAVDAREDDRIYAAVVDYDLWEYPVYGNRELQGHVLVVLPKVTENRWFPSKSWSGYTYIPSHEVGNILSYREYADLDDNPEVEEKIKGDYSNSFVLDANSSYDWSLQFEDFTANEASTSKSYSREWGVDVDIWGSGYSTSSSYSREEISTHKTEVANGLNLSVHLDGIDMGLGEVSYIVTPYAYWAANGALVIDYAVKPELAQPSGTPTWWQVKYGQLSDPAFILPWRYDPEKGFKLEQGAKRLQTKDLVFLPSDPSEGETVRIQARLHNFSLIPTPGPVGVKFYVGDPDSSGTLISGKNGAEGAFTAGPVPARGHQVAEIEWQLPPAIGAYPRIYAVIDADKILPEIHENNNKSWAILQKSTTTAVPVTAAAAIPSGCTLKHNYPNPFNPLTVISFSLPAAQKVRLDVFNARGEWVTTLVEGRLSAGEHLYRFDARNQASGIYFYRLMAGAFSQTNKMILLH